MMSINIWEFSIRLLSAWIQFPKWKFHIKWTHSRTNNKLHTNQIAKKCDSMTQNSKYQLVIWPIQIFHFFMFDNNEKKCHVISLQALDDDDDDEKNV